MEGGVFILDLGFLFEAVPRKLQHVHHPFVHDGIGRIWGGLSSTSFYDICPT
jgi:hypothetical protein